MAEDFTPLTIYGEGQDCFHVDSPTLERSYRILAAQDTGSVRIEAGELTLRVHGVFDGTWSFAISTTSPQSDWLTARAERSYWDNSEWVILDLSGEITVTAEGGVTVKATPIFSDQKTGSAPYRRTQLRYVPILLKACVAASDALATLAGELPKNRKQLTRLAAQVDKVTEVFGVSGRTIQRRHDMDHGARWIDEQRSAIPKLGRTAELAIHQLIDCYGQVDADWREHLVDIISDAINALEKVTGKVIDW
jgi:hypothetical protein